MNVASLGHLTRCCSSLEGAKGHVVAQMGGLKLCTNVPCADNKAFPPSIPSLFRCSPIEPIRARPVLNSKLNHPVGVADGRLRMLESIARLELHDKVWSCALPLTTQTLTASPEALPRLCDYGEFQILHWCDHLPAVGISHLAPRLPVPIEGLLCFAKHDVSKELLPLRLEDTNCRRGLLNLPVSPPGSALPSSSRTALIVAAPWRKATP